MKRNIIKLQKGSVSIEKETVREKKQSLKETQRVNELLSESLGLGIGIALPIAGGAILGTALDKLFNTAPKLTLGLLVVGLLISFSSLIRIAITAGKK